MQFMVGFQANGDKFAWFTLALVLLQNTGASIGILAACMFNSIEVCASIIEVRAWSIETARWPCQHN